VSLVAGIEAFHEVTGRYPKVDQKLSLIDLNRQRSIEELEAEQRAVMVNGKYGEGFRRDYSTYVGSIEEWKRVTGKDNVFAYSRGSRLSRESYNQSRP
jgi:antirestriction protein ArdC